MSIKLNKKNFVKISETVKSMSNKAKTVGAFICLDACTCTGNC